MHVFVWRECVRRNMKYVLTNLANIAGKWRVYPGDFQLTASYIILFNSSDVVWNE